MAEPVGLASGLLALAIFAFQSSVTLHNTIKSFKSHPKRVRDLIEEVEALSGVLGPLTETIESTTDVDLSLLDLPLLRCGSACKEFEHQLRKCSASGDRTSFRDWAKLRYMGDDIDGFRNLLAGYKLTVNVALTDANLRKSAITAESLKGYKNLILTATEDLETHLESIDEKLDALVQQTVKDLRPNAEELRQIETERLSAQKCLQICEQLSHHIDQMQLTPKRGSQPAETTESGDFSQTITRDSLTACKANLNLTAVKLEKHMKDLTNRLIQKSKTVMTSEEEVEDVTRLQEQWEAARQCIEFCSRADENLKTTASTIDNYAIGDAVQFMVSTNGKVLHGKNRGMGWRTRQVGGYLSDAAVMQISRDMSSSIGGTKADHSLNIEHQPSPNVAVNDDSDSNFKERYGQGKSLEAEISSQSQKSSQQLAGSQKHGLPIR